jgi:glycosyltransferase involved in cell wall biosynthesis
MDDEETALKPIPLHPVRLAGDLLSPDGGISRKVMGPATSRVDALTVASTTLQKRFGGELIFHAKDTDTLSPKPGRREEWRDRLGLPSHPVVLFLGTPRPWKGVEDAARAVQALPFEATFLVVGADETEFARRLGSLPRVRTHPMIPLSHLPGFLEAADLVVIPQRADPITRIQMPSKLFDAMAMARPILATAASDIPRILAEGRGSVVPPGDVPRLTEAMGRILGNPRQAEAMGRRAREWCVKHASLQAARGPMQRAMARAIARRGTVDGNGGLKGKGGPP